MNDVKLRTQQPDLRTWAEQHPDQAAQLDQTSQLSAKPVPEPEPEPQSQPQLSLDHGMEIQQQQPLRAIVVEVMDAVDPGRADNDSASTRDSLEAAVTAPTPVAVVGNPSFIGIPIPQALFHPPPNGTLARCHSV